MAKALRAKGVVFVEGKDLKTLRILAKNLGFAKIVADMELAVVPINGYSHWGSTEAVGWQTQVDAVTAQHTEAGLHCHVWHKKKLESYLISPTAISGISGCPLAEVEQAMDAIMANMYGEVFAKINFERKATEKSAKFHEVNITAATLADFAPSGSIPNIGVQCVRLKKSCRN
jgi:hypothetical protein